MKVYWLMVRFLNWQMSRCGLRKDFFLLFAIDLSSPPVVADQPDKRLANRFKKRRPSVGVVRQAQSAWFIV